MNLSDINFHDSQSQSIEIPSFILNVQTLMDSIQEIFFSTCAPDEVECVEEFLQWEIKCVEVGELEFIENTRWQTH